MKKLRQHDILNTGKKYIGEMIVENKLRFPSATGLGDICADLWIPQTNPIAIVQIVHGMAEHIGRYSQFVSYLQNNGILVVAHDHAGHGASLGERAVKGYFGERDGWNNLLLDINRLHATAATQYPGIPYIVFGHSMGSFLARSYAAKYGEGIAAFVFSGTAGNNPAIAAGRLIGRMERLRNGPAQPSKLLDQLSFGTYNKAFAPAKTPFDWLSRDTVRVDEYVADPLCGFVFTAEGMLDLFDGLQSISGLGWAAKVPNVPVLLFSGDNDPVGAKGKGVQQVYSWLRDTGHDVQCTLYPGGRHEMLNELNRYDVYSDILAFIQKVV